MEEIETEVFKVVRHNRYIMSYMANLFEQKDTMPGARFSAIVTRVPYELEYYEGEITYPKNRKSRLFAFDDMEAAGRFARRLSQSDNWIMEVWAATAFGPILYLPSCSHSVEYVKYLDGFWELGQPIRAGEREHYSATLALATKIPISSTPDHTVGCRSLRLNKLISTWKAGILGRHE